MKQNTKPMAADVDARPGRLLRRREVLDRIGVSTSTLYQWMGEGDFPRPVHLGSRLVAWREADVDRWIAARALKGAA